MRNRHLTSAVVMVAILLGAGCVTKEFSYSTKIAGGEQLKFTISGGRVAPAKAEGITIMEAGLRPDPAGKQVIYGFQFHDTANHSLQNVKIEDVSEDTALLVHEDTEPKLVQQRWSVVTKPFEKDDPVLRWVFYLNDSVRVYRFTITTTDGKKIVLHQAAMVPAWVKAAVRNLFGEKY